MNRLKAYTILEITIAMMVSAIVISITYTVFGIISGAYGQYKREQEDILTLTQLDLLLKKDCAAAGYIFNSPEGLVFGEKEGRAVYVFSPDYVTRTLGVTDTFKVSTHDVEMSFEHTPLPLREELRADSVIIDGLSFSITFKGHVIPYIYHKQYSSDQLIIHTPDAIH